MKMLIIIIFRRGLSRSEAPVRDSKASNNCKRGFKTSAGARRFDYKVYLSPTSGSEGNTIAVKVVRSRLS